jgi:hypothetical protein
MQLAEIDTDKIKPFVACLRDWAEQVEEGRLISRVEVAVALMAEAANLIASVPDKHLRHIYTEGVISGFRAGIETIIREQHKPEPHG